MDGYMADPKGLSDDQLGGWVRNFRSNPPTMDFMSEWGWARRIMAEAQERAERARASLRALEGAGI